MNQNRYVASGVSVRALNAYYRKTVQAQEEIHTLQIWQGDRCLCRLAPAPYSCDDRREVYSLSKTFCSTAIGCAVDEGLLRVDDRIVDIFPDKLPETVSEHLAHMRVRHVLSMNTGHAACVMPKMYASDDVARAFLAEEVAFEPGTHFTYNTGATCLLSAIISRVTGESLYDYLSRKILFPMGIRDVVWNTCGEGVNEGGCGIQITGDEIVRLGRLYRNRGIWEGKRLLSEEWIAEATAVHSDNSANGTPDWQSGYGYQIWNNSRDGYRGDGARGQLMLILPQHDFVVAVQGLVGNMQTEIDLVMELVEHLLDGDDEEELCLPDYTPAQPGDGAFPTGWYHTEENVFGWKTLHLYRDGGTLIMDASDGRSTSRFRAGAGEYAISAYTAPWRKPKLLSLMDAHVPETIRSASYYEVQDGVCRITSRHLCDPHTEVMTITEQGGLLQIDFSMPGLLPENAQHLRAHRLG